MVEGVIGTEEGHSIISLISQDSSLPSLPHTEVQTIRFYLKYPIGQSHLPYQFSNQPMVSPLSSNQVMLNLDGGTPLSEGFALIDESTGTQSYVIREDYIASGGVNDVYQGKLISSTGEIKKVAIKQGRSKWDSDSGSYRSVHSLQNQKKILTDASLAQELDPNIATEVYGATLAKNQHGVEVAMSVMEFQKGETLDEYIIHHFGNLLESLLKNPDQMVSGPAWDFLLQLRPEMEKILLGLQREGIVHGDIKPVNLLVEMIDGKLRLRLTDFDTMGRVGTLSEMGTPNYFPPNVLFESAKGVYPTRTIDLDRYAMQSTLHKIVFGSVPYQKLKKQKRMSPLLREVGKYETKEEFFQEMNLLEKHVEKTGKKF